jgi:hypothetical protein
MHTEAERCNTTINELSGEGGRLPTVPGFQHEIRIIRLVEDGLAWLGCRVYDMAKCGNDPVNPLDPWGLFPLSAEGFDKFRGQFSGGMAGAKSNAWDAAGSWLKDNWEYVAAGALVVAGGVMMATGVGGPVGMALVSAGADAIIQKATTGSVDWGAVAVNGVIGLASGGIAGAAGRAVAKSVTNCLGSNILSGAAEGFVDGAFGGLEYLTSGQPITLQGLAQNTLLNGGIGAFTGGVAGGMSAVTDTARHGCFEADTQVLMADGTTKAIQEPTISAGSMVTTAMARPRCS